MFVRGYEVHCNIVFWKHIQRINPVNRVIGNLEVGFSAFYFVRQQTVH